MPNPRVAYVWSPELQAVADDLPANVGRSSMVHGLVRALGLLDGSGRDSAEQGRAARDSKVGVNGHEKGPGRSSDDSALKGDGQSVKMSSESDGRRARADIVVVPPDEALGTADSLKRYHDASYVDYLLGTRAKATENDGDEYNPECEGDEASGDSDDSHYSLRDGPARKRLKSSTHGLEHDCPPFPALARYASLVAAGTVTACRFLINADSPDEEAPSSPSPPSLPTSPAPGPSAPARAPIAIHLDGGRHHAARSRASGFCYVADAVLGIMHLARSGKGRGGRRPRIMYLDLDLHYGDGVAQAFHSPARFDDATAEGARARRRPPQVLTLSVHHASPIFFPPATPLSALPASDTPSPFSLSIPLHAYPAAPTYAALWPAVERVRAAFEPDYVVLQLGADGLAGDHIGRFGAWHTEGAGGMRWCVARARAWGLPMCVLGGGGYDHASTARAWALVVADLVGEPLDAKADVPDHEWYTHYAPAYTLEVTQSHARDENTQEYLDEINETYEAIAERIARIVA